MQKDKKKKRKYRGWRIFGIIVLLLAAWLLYMKHRLVVNPPEGMDMTCVADSVVDHGNYRQVGNNYLRKNDAGLWEMYLEGDAFHRGVAYGKLTKDLLHYQEKVFVDKIREMIPSDTYLSFLKYLIAFFNRNLTEYVPQEYQEEIYGISLSCSHEYDFIGSPYQRQLNYHSAHDIGHALQDLMLVGCTSFAAWDEQSADSTLIIGRNFDFYMGDDFAANKLISFYSPDKGYKFAMVGWAGMVGVLSGMNEAGLTVTINASKSSIPTSSATPISILTRCILQYASTIDEAYEIAKQHKTFVSESILIGSAKDGKAAIIEKSPKAIDIYYSSGHSLVCANHYQSKTFENDERNVENIKNSDSHFRFDRAGELLATNAPITPEKAASILRNKQGKEGAAVGYGNEMAIDQMIAHHAVIFVPAKRIMYVSTSPWQDGQFIAYNLNEVFASHDFSKELRSQTLCIPADTFLLSKNYADFIKFKECTQAIKKSIDAKHILNDSILNTYTTLDPDYYYGYEKLGDYYKAIGNKEKAIQYWKQALTKAIPKTDITKSITEKINDK